MFNYNKWCNFTTIYGIDLVPADEPSLFPCRKIEGLYVEMEYISPISALRIKPESVLW